MSSTKWEDDWRAFGRSRAVAKKLGLISALLYGLDRVLVRLGTGIRIFRYYLVAQPVPAQRRVAVPRGRSFVVREIGRSDPALRAMPLTPAVIDYRIRQPTVCLGAFKGEQLIAYLWLCLGPYEEDEVRCRFVPIPEGEAVWDFDVYVFPAYRSGRAFARLWDEANCYLRSRGVAWSMSRISAFSPNSLAAHLRLGARRVGRANFLRWRGGQIMVASVPPYLHIALDGGRHPEVRLCGPGAATSGR